MQQYRTFTLACCAIILFGFSRCKNENLQPYSGKDAICFSDNGSGNIAELKQIQKHFSWASTIDPNALIDTCWIEVMSVGRVSHENRPIILEQKTAIGLDYVYDTAGNVVDSLLFIIPYQAISGVDFEPFDTPSLQEKMVLPAGKFKHRIPVVLKKTSDEHRKILLIQMKETPTTLVAEERLSTCLITIE